MYNTKQVFYLFTIHMNNSSEKRPEELFDAERVKDFLRKNPNILDNRNKIVTGQREILLTTKDIWDTVLKIRHEMWKEEKKGTSESEIDKKRFKVLFDKAYNDVVGQEKYITGYKAVVGYLLHIFKTNDVSEKRMDEIQHINDELKKIFGLDRKKIFKEYGDKVDELKRKEAEHWLSPYQERIAAIQEITQKYSKQIETTADDLTDLFIRKEDILKNKKLTNS